MFNKFSVMYIININVDRLLNLISSSQDFIALQFFRKLFNG